MPNGTNWPFVIRVTSAGTTGEVRAIHEGGVRVRLRDPSPRPGTGDRLDLRCSIPDIDPALTVSGRVVSVTGEDTPDADLAIDVAFDEPSGATVQLINFCGRLDRMAIEQAQAVVAGLYDPTVMLDLQFRVLHYNSPYIKLSGMRPRALQRELDSGTSSFAIVGSDPVLDRELAADAIRLARAVHVAQASFTNTAGDRYVGTLSFLPLLGPFGAVLALIQTFRDESAENRMQEHYKKLLAYERQRVERMARLVTGLAHQINTPLGIINTACSVIDSSLDTTIAALVPSTATNNEELDTVVSQLRATSELLHKNLAKVNALVTKVRDLSTTQLSARREHADLGELVEETVTTLAPAMKARAITANFLWPPGSRFPWNGYPEHLMRVLRELIQNTISHGYPDTPGGTLDIRITAVTEKDLYQLELEDYGGGIEQTLLPQVLEPFVTSDPGSATGLGLAIVENIIDNLLSGRLEYASELGSGSKFTIFLPQHVPEPRT